jgi:hypothetical protein
MTPSPRFAILDGANQIRDHDHDTRQGKPLPAFMKLNGEWVIKKVVLGGNTLTPVKLEAITIWLQVFRVLLAPPRSPAQLRFPGTVGIDFNFSAALSPERPDRPVSVTRNPLLSPKTLARSLGAPNVFPSRNSPRTQRLFRLSPENGFDKAPVVNRSYGGGWQAGHGDGASLSRSFGSAVGKADGV